MIDPLLILLLLPALGAIGVTVVPRRAICWTALGVSIVAVFLALTLLARFEMHAAGLFGTTVAAPGNVLLQVQMPWLRSPAIDLHLGADGLSLPLVLLTTFIFVIAVIASWRVERAMRGYFPLLLILEAAVLGAFLSLNGAMFCTFLLICLMPTYLLIAGWGTGRKEMAAMKLALATLTAVGILLTAMIVLDLNVHSFDLTRLPSLVAEKCSVSKSFARFSPALFAMMVIAGLALSAVVPPVHGWLAETLAAAPTAVSIVISAVTMKIGIYILLRIADPIFPSVARHFWLPMVILGIASLLYGGLCALAQADFKRLIAFLSMSQMGLALVGISILSPMALSGTVLLLIGHGLSVAMLYFISDVIEHRAGQRDLTLFGGLATSMPRLWGFSAAGFFAAIGLPASSLFVAQLLVVIGTFSAMRGDAVLVSANLAHRATFCALGILELLGVLLNAASLLWAMQRIFLGPQRAEQKEFADLDERETTLAAVAIGAVLLLGIFPGQFFFPITSRSIHAISDQLAGPTIPCQLPASTSPATSHAD